MEILKGADVVAAINQSIKDELATMSYVPQLAIIRVGEKPDDISYERGATKRMETVGLRCTSYHYPEDITDKEFKKAFMSINDDEDVDAILLLRPLPKHIKESDIEKMINPVKDVDGISPVNMAKIYSGDKTGFAPCTPTAVIEMLDYAGIDLAGKRVAIVGRSLVVGKPLAMLMIGRNATVTVCHTKTVDMKETCKNAEIVVAAAGKAKMLNNEYVGEGAVVVDVGINMDENFKLCGDVDFESITEVAKMATPVPGGVGTVTTSVLAKHVVAAAKMRRG